MQYLIYLGEGGLVVQPFSNSPSVINAVYAARNGKKVVWVTDPKKIVDTESEKAFLLLSGTPVVPSSY